MEIKAHYAFSEGEPGFLDGDGFPHDGTAVFFPIIQLTDPPPWIPIGTGFFISNNGLFATAKHVLTDARGNLLPSLYGVHMMIADGIGHIREVQKVMTHPNADVAIGFLFDKRFREEGVQTVNKLMALTRTVPALGSKVFTAAYPKSESGTKAEKTFTVTFKMDVVEGTLEAFYPDGRDRVLLPGRCFQTSMNLPGGASGGPVFGANGCAFGINSTGMDGLPVSYVSSVESLLELEIAGVRFQDGTIKNRVPVLELVDRGLVVVR